MQLSLNDTYKLSSQDTSACSAILKQYKNWGESKFVIEKAEDEIKRLVKNKYRIKSILPNYRQLLEQAESTRSHNIIRLSQHNSFKVSIHIIPSYFKIPAHLHPDLISIIDVQQGELHIEQLTLSNQEERVSHRLKKHQACAGLFKLRNIHRIQTLSSPCIFLSFRISKKLEHKHSLLAFIPLIPAFLFLFPSALTSNKPATEKNHPLSHSSHYSVKPPTNSNITIANKLRLNTSAYQDLYQAASLYKREAIKGNAEAQYWLGVMYFDGSGITEDSEEALRWVAMSAEQNYPPAKKLLHHFLTTDEVLDC